MPVHTAPTMVAASCTLLPGEAQWVKVEATRVSIGLTLELALKAEEGSLLCLAARLPVVHPPLALNPSKQQKLDHQQCACIGHIAFVACHLMLISVALAI